MSTTAHPEIARAAEGAATVERLHNAWRTGTLRAAPAARRPAMTSDPLLLGVSNPTLTQRQAARHHRSAPYLHLVHRVDTATDIPDSMGGVAIGYTALPDEPGHTSDDQYQAEPIVPVDRKLRALTWRAIAGVYLITGLALVLVLRGA